MHACREVGKGGRDKGKEGCREVGKGAGMQVRMYLGKDGFRKRGMHNHKNVSL